VVETDPPCRRSLSLRRRALLSVLGMAAVTSALVVVLAGRRGQFTTALHSLPVWLLVSAVLLQIVALLSRTEAWNVCIRATGATVTRRVLYRSAGVGYLASVLNGSLGLAARLTSLRRSAPDTSPRVPALLAAEVPIISVEVALAAIFSFTLVSAIGAPWWVPVIAVALALTAVLALRRVSERRRVGLWSGLAVMRSGRERMIALVLLSICCQIARNYFVLRGIGAHISLFDAIALLIAMFTLGQLPIGPSLGAAATVLILGAHGVATAAAAGVLLTVTATFGSLLYAAWAVTDRLLAGQIVVSPEPTVVSSPA
jgi:uncharacterized membrane protein YbhN (UPF0104 family)